MSGCGKRVGLGPGIRGMGRCGTTVIMGSVFVCEACQAKAARAAKKAAKEARKPKPAEPKPAPLPPNPPCLCCGVGVEPGPRDDGFTDGERVACGHCGATNYPTVADDGTVEMSDGAEDEGDETKPAPVVAAEGLFGWIDTTDGSWVHVGPMPRAEAESRPNLRNRERRLVRVLDDGAHEAALAAAYERGKAERPTANAAPVAYRYDVAGYPPSWATFRIGDVQGQTETPLYDGAALAAAREEGRREAAGRIARLVDALQNVLDGCSELTPHAIVEIEYALEEEREDAAKGAAK